MTNLTPAMRQYMEIKEQHPDCLVLFRMGDFYETFYEDAVTAAKELDIVLTKRGKGEKQAPLAGLPYHSLEPYLAKLIKKGYKVCIVEQLEDPKQAKGVVKRGVVRIVTPGTVIEDTLLTEQSNNYIMSLNKEGTDIGIALADVSTGEFLSTSLTDPIKVFAEVEKYHPAEIIVPLSFMDSPLVKELQQKGFLVHNLDDRFYVSEKSVQTIKKQWKVLSLEGFGLSDDSIATTAVGSLLAYLQDTQLNNLTHLRQPKIYTVDEFMVIDAPTQRNLELLKNIRENTARGTLYDVINKTTTPMGARKLKQWMLRPLLQMEEITKRLEAVEELKDNALLREEIKELIDQCADVERIMGKVTYGTCMPRDLLLLKQSLAILPPLKALLAESKSGLLKGIAQTQEFTAVTELISNAIKDEPAATVREGNIIKEGYHKELDDLRKISTSGKSWIAELEEKEKEKTGIKSLKIRYNKVFGYFIEVTKANLNLVPDTYIRKQTQVNHERFITEDLKQQEEAILGAQEKINALEFDLFGQVIESVAKQLTEIQQAGQSIAGLDCIMSLSTVAAEKNYCRPELSSDNILSIIGGRHPVVEVLEPRFVDNDTQFDQTTALKVITGPNMSGKSTYLRQVALITLLAQMGSFVPATQAHIGVVDRIFSRVGAYDDLSMGQSTFMVEMNETANILNSATEKSLIIMDEIGRGTSTYDGFSLAWAIAEYLCTHIKAKTLFATHYHQLNTLSDQFPKVKNYHIEVLEKDDDIIFLRKIKEGGTDKSYGVQVAKLAGVPQQVIDQAKDMMATLEQEDKLMRTVQHIPQDTSSKSKEQEDKKELQQTLSF